MNRIPPSLLYLTIYNPTLRLSEPFEYNDEDAEEQAHILFYTSKERAVSRDRMLRQVGLAKALVNFAQQFSGGDPCNNIHSQGRRMVMISPEPDFWIHACFEIAKVIRAPDPKGKSKTKTKADKGKAEPVAQYDLEDWSIHDNAMRACILKSYERFKLTHGSFSSILHTLGQQALELQLERFWTVWAWSLDMEEDPNFAEAFGPSLHPHFSSLSHLVNDFNSNLSATTTAVVLSRHHVIPSARYTQGRYPAAFAHHLSYTIPPSASLSTMGVLAESVETIRGKGPEDFQPPTSSSKVTEAGKSTFLGTMAMDMRKWNWPEYLTFGKGNMTNPSSERSSSFSESEKNTEEEPISPVHPQVPSQVEVEVNANDLQDAIASESISLTLQRPSPREATRDLPPDHVDGLHGEPNGSASTKDSTDVNSTHDQESFSAGSTTFTHQGEETLPSTPPSPLPEFSLTKLHLAPWDKPTETQQVSIHYLIKQDYLLALLLHEQADESLDTENADLKYAAGNVLKLFDDIESTIQDLDMNITDSPPSAAKILQRDDQYLINTGPYTLSSPGFTSNTGHLFNAKAILDADPGIHEVFSRGLNPQHWHIAKRGFGGSNSALGLTGCDETVFMEVFRKETSLADVDNVLTGIVKKSGIVEGSFGSRTD